jgi:hypothetical protein
MILAFAAILPLAVVAVVVGKHSGSVCGGSLAWRSSPGWSSLA